MKKVSLFVVLAAFAGVVMAQGVEKKNEIGLGIGSTTYINYPAVSLFQDNQPEYSSFGERFSYGRRVNNHLWGAELNVNYVNTSLVAYDETMLGIGLALMYRHYEHVGERVEPFFGVKIGPTLLMNSYDVVDRDSKNRLGAMASLELGVNFNLNNGNYFGVSTGFNAATVSNKQQDLPAGTIANKRYGIAGYDVSFTYGIRF